MIMWKLYILSSLVIKIKIVATGKGGGRGGWQGDSPHLNMVGAKHRKNFTLKWEYQKNWIFHIDDRPGGGGGGPDPPPKCRGVGGSPHLDMVDGPVIRAWGPKNLHFAPKGTKKLSEFVEKMEKISKHP